MKVPKRITQHWGLKTFVNKPDTFWNMGGDDNTGNIFLDSGLSIFTAIGWAHALKHKLKDSGHLVEVYGYRADDNPSCIMPDGYDGMDFCVIDGRLIVNLWLEEIEQKYRAFSVVDMIGDNVGLRFYGAKNKWVKE